MDVELLHELAQKHAVFVTLEENVKRGGFGESVSVFLSSHHYGNINHINISLPDVYIEHGDRKTLELKYELDIQSIIKRICEEVQ